VGACSSSKKIWLVSGGCIRIANVGFTSPSAKPIRDTLLPEVSCTVPTSRNELTTDLTADVATSGPADTESYVRVQQESDMASK
jgi:hypothetical protein